MSESLPVWEERVRAPALSWFSLFGPTVSWATDSPERGVLLCSLSGRVEVYAFDTTTDPGLLTQVSDRPQGTIGAAVSRDGDTVFWFDDTMGDELGRWVATLFDDVTKTSALLGALEPSYPVGIKGLTDGRVLVGRLEGESFQLAVADPRDGSHELIYRGSEFGFLVDATPAGDLALIGYTPNGDYLHLGARVVRTSDGEVVAELQQDERHIMPIAFNPRDPDQVLVVHEPDDLALPMIWNLRTGTRTDVVTGLAGEVRATWYPDGQSLLLVVGHDARERLHRWDFETHELTPLPTVTGSVQEAIALPDGSVQALVSSSVLPVSLLRIRGALVEHAVRLPHQPPPGVLTTDVHADGPGGRVHGLVNLPTLGGAPYPTVFLVHGGPTGQDRDSWAEIPAALVDQGYAVVRVNYRGSTGYGAAWRDALRRRPGFIELEDITAVRERLEQDGVVDPSAVSIMGGSWGGYLTLMAVGMQPDRWRSGAALVPLADWLVALEDSPPWMASGDASMMQGTVEEIPEAYRAASPITYVDDVVAPLFVSAGENDPRCPVRQVDGYVERLRARGHDVRYERLGAGHALPDLDMRVLEMRQLLEFFAKTLPVEASDSV